MEAFIALLNFAGLLDCIAESSDSAKCVSFNNKPCLGRSILIDLNPNELDYYSFRLQQV